MITAYPFDSQITGYTEGGAPIYDRPAGAELLRTVFRDYFTNGVMTPLAADALQIVPDSGMTVTVKPGAGVINGAIMHSDSDISLPLDAADSLPRIDRIVLRLDDNVNVRAMEIFVLKGTASSSPTAPQITRSAMVHELVLADISVPANVAAIAAANIIDRRNDTVLCGACGARLNSETILAALDSDQIRHIEVSTAALAAGISPLESGKLYLCYEAE